MVYDNEEIELQVLRLNTMKSSREKGTELGIGHLKLRK